MAVCRELVGIPILRKMACVEGLEGRIDSLNGIKIKILIIKNISAKYLSWFINH